MAKTDKAADTSATEAATDTTNAAAADTTAQQPTDAAQAFPGTDDTRTVADVDKEIKDANSALRVQHLDALEAKINELGGYAVSQLKPLVDQLRGVC